MTYNEIQNYMQAAFYYANVTDEEFKALAVSHYMTIIGGVRYVGTNEPVEALADREIVKPADEPAAEAPTDAPVDEQ